MCFRLLAAARDSDAPAWEALALECGLDIRVAKRGPARFAEIAWGECACSLYTRRDGRERVIRFVEALCARQGTVQLLLVRDEEPLHEGALVPVDLADFRREALAALPEGRVAELHSSPS